MTLDQIISIDPAVFKKANQLYMDWWEKEKDMFIGGVLKEYRWYVNFEVSVKNRLPNLKERVKSIHGYTAFDFLRYDFDLHKNNLYVSYKPTDVDVSFWSASFPDVIIHDKFANEKYLLSDDIKLVQNHEMRI